MTQATFRGFTAQQLLMKAAARTGGADIMDHKIDGLVTTSVRQGGERDSLEDRIAVAKVMPLKGLLDWPQQLRAAYQRIAGITKTYGREGSTALTAVVTTDNILHLAHLGDCTAILVSEDEAGAIEARLLNKEHHPSDPAEKARIESEGGEVHPTRQRVCRDDDPEKTCANSRAFGDMDFPGVSKEPELIEIDFAQEKKKPLALLLLTDGILNAEKLPLEVL